MNSIRSNPGARWEGSAFLLVSLWFLTWGAEIALAQRQLAEEAKLFAELKAGVFTVYSDYGQGSGFLVDSDGLVVTNAHVLAGSERIRVILDPGLKVEARALVVDEAEDLALIRIHPSFCEDRPVLKLPESFDDFVAQGERVFAMGSPLGHRRVLTTGVVSGIDDDGIISDVNINPGNSGGPLVNLAGEVVGVVTYGESADQGSGLAGSISTRLLSSRLADARRELDDAEPLSTELYPCMPDDDFPLSALQNAARLPTWPDDAYEMGKVPTAAVQVEQRRTRGAVKKVDYHGFTINVITPPHFYRITKANEIEAAKNRSDRTSKESKSGYDPIESLRNWAIHSGAFPPIVTFWVMPKITSDSGFFTDKYMLQADLEEFELRIDDEVVEELHRRFAWMTLDFEVRQGWRKAKGSDVARAGNMAYDPRVFARRSDGTWPRVTVRIESAGKDAEPLAFDLPVSILERIAIDFQPYFWAIEARDTVRRAGGR